jgi:hypothetical protein
MAMEGPVWVETRGAQGVPAAQFWRYSFPNVKGEGWAIIFLDFAGCFAALSDYGDWSYRWNSRGFAEGEDLRTFLVTCDDDYLMSKLGQGRKEYDGAGSFDAAKKAILSARRDGELEQEEAREEWDALHTFDELKAEYDFGMWYAQSKISDAGECFRNRYPQQLVEFLRLEMPRLREALRAEMKL